MRIHHIAVIAAALLGGACATTPGAEPVSTPLPGETCKTKAECMGSFDSDDVDVGPVDIMTSVGKPACKPVDHLYECTVKAQNPLEKRADLAVTIEMVDAGGDRVEAQMGLEDNVGPGQRVVIETAMPEEIGTYPKDVRFRVIEATAEPRGS